MYVRMLIRNTRISAHTIQFLKFLNLNIALQFLKFSCIVYWYINLKQFAIYISCIDNFYLKYRYLSCIVN